VAELATERMVVAAPPEQCFAVVSDIARYPEWAGDIKDVSVQSRDGEGRPAEVTFGSALSAGSSSNTLSYDYSLAPGLWPGADGRDLTSKFDGRYSFERADNGSTEVTYTLEVELRVPLPGFIKRRAQSRIMHTALEELKARVESSLTK